MSRGEQQPLGISGRLAGYFLNNQITPLLALAAMLLGLFAVWVTPREEEPQIDVTFANIFIPFPGASSTEVESLVVGPMERVLGEIAGVKHIYSVSRPGMGVITVQFEVGEARTEAVVRLYNAIYSNQDWRPPGLGVLQPLVKPGGIEDVPILTLTLWSRDASRSPDALAQVARSLQTEIKRVPGTRDVYAVGAPDHLVKVELDPRRVAGRGRLLSWRPWVERPCGSSLIVRAYPSRVSFVPNLVYGSLHRLRSIEQSRWRFGP